MEDIKELNLNEEQAGQLTEFINKRVQSESDKIRTEYSGKLAELEKYKPKELTDEQKELESAKKELADLKFKSSLKNIGVSDDMAEFIKSDVDMTSSRNFMRGSSLILKKTSNQQLMLKMKEPSCLCHDGQHDLDGYSSHLCQFGAIRL